MPFIEVKMLSGRSDDQKKKLAAAITDAIVDICQSPRDGTMVVIENGRRYINSSHDVQVTRVLQTAAGRIIFAQPRAG